MTVSFKVSLDSWVNEIQGQGAELIQRVNNHVERSLRFGSHVTGAPGQPVKTRFLLESYIRGGSLATGVISHSFTAPYASIIEHNARGATLRSKVGGWHSVKLTRLGFNRIVDYEATKMKPRRTVFKGGFFREAGTGRFAKVPR